MKLSCVHAKRLNVCQTQQNVSFNVTVLSQHIPISLKFTVSYKPLSSLRANIDRRQKTKSDGNNFNFHIRLILRRCYIASHWSTRSPATDDKREQVDFRERQPRAGSAEREYLSQRTLGRNGGAAEWRNGANNRRKKPAEGREKHRGRERETVRAGRVLVKSRCLKIRAA